MALNVKIDFDRVYTPNSISDDLRTTEFATELQKGTTEPLKVLISNEVHELLPDTYNLAFGPVKANGHIDDKVRLIHKDYSRVFSSILLAAGTYLLENPDHFIGLDGSDNNRAYLYYKFLQHNYDYLNEYFDIFGIKYYVRISRLGKTQYDNPFNFDDIQPTPIKIIKGQALLQDEMYNYFTFRLKQPNLKFHF